MKAQRMIPSRNQVCPCGSGRKFKVCCGRIAPGHQGSLNEAAALNNAGNALARAGRLEEALTSYRQALVLQPDFAEAHRNLGCALLECGEAREAAAHCQRATELKPRYADAHASLGDALLASGSAAEAAASFRRALDIDPQSAETHNQLGLALLELGSSHEAIASFRHAVSIEPALAEAHNNLGNALRGLGELHEAAAAYHRALAARPDFAEAHSNLGATLRLQGHTAAAEASCRRAIELDPRSTAPYLVLADSSADGGRFSDAEALLRRALAIEPSAQVWASFARLRKMTRDDAAWIEHAQALVARGLRPRDEVPLRHAIGKYFDDVGEFDQAFESHQRANELARRASAPHDRAELTRIVDEIVCSYDEGWFRRMRPSGSASERPVFVVGMPRSGTTLVEQILASHPAVFGAGELVFWTSAAAACSHNPGSIAAELRTLTESYLQILDEASPDAFRVVDKMPTNFVRLGLIHAALPNARIIHMQRNPLDTCLSIYFQHFEAAAAYATDLGDLAHYFAEYSRVMQHWRLTLPHAILEVPYEGLVDDLELWTRRMLEFIGVPWDMRCLAFHRTERKVITASQWQVRQQITRSSVGRWRNYEKHLRPLMLLAPSRDPEATFRSAPSPQGVLD